MGEERPLKFEVMRYILVFLCTFLIMFITFHYIRFPSVFGKSMYPTYDDGDRVIVLYTTNVDRNDVIIAWCDMLGEHVVKRVIGIEGDHIEIRDNHLYRNGVELYESYLNEQNWVLSSDTLDIIVPNDCVFLLGDNRLESTDSRVFGSIPLSKIYGKVLIK